MASSKVLVVEDDPIVLMSAAQALRAIGHTVIEAETADDAQAILECEPVEVAVVFSDIDMPGRINGLALARTIGVRWPQVAVVLTSGHATPPACELAPCVRFIRKPYELDDVTEIISDLTRSVKGL